MKKHIRIALIAFSSLCALTMATLLVSAAVYSPAYMAHILLNGESKITDYRIFPERTIARNARCRLLPAEDLADMQVKVVRRLFPAFS